MKGLAGIAMAALIGGLAPTPAAGEEIDPFYTRMFREGIRSSERGDHLQASEELRIAAFGLMENPNQLALALTHLALSQSSAGNSEGFEATARRLAELEDRFGAYSSADLGTSARTAFDRAARSLLPAEELEDSPLVEQAPLSPARDSVPASEAKLCISWTVGGSCREAGTTAREPGDTETGSMAADTALALGISAEEMVAFDRLSRLASGKGSSRKLRKGFEETRALADRHPQWPEVQRLAGLLAARSASYSEAVTYFRRSGDPAEDQPIELFYLSVALFETGGLEEAAETLRRALPGLEQNREVRRYVRQILPTETQS